MELRLGKKLDRIADYVDALILARREWASSEEGRRTLGPGSPTIPGMQDLLAIRDRIKAIR